MSIPDWLVAARKRFDAENAADPRRAADGRPYRVAHADWLEAWVRRLEPAPSPALALAARCQHLRRFDRPRADFPEGRKGYLAWRAAAARAHAALAEELALAAGVPEAERAALRPILLKQGLGRPGDAQTMEDALCLTFLAHELGDFAAQHPRDKVIDILQKTWRKMSAPAQALARGLPLGEAELGLVRAALETPAPAP